MAQTSTSLFCNFVFHFSEKEKTFPNKIKCGKIRSLRIQLIVAR